jgi:hypothetical protein
MFARRGDKQAHRGSKFPLPHITKNNRCTTIPAKGSSPAFGPYFRDDLKEGRVRGLRRDQTVELWHHVRSRTR